jgi:hypothetical protein
MKKSARSAEDILEVIVCVILSEAKISNISGPIPTETNQRCFVSLNMTAPFKGWFLSIVYDLQSAAANCNRQLSMEFARKSVAGARAHFSCSLVSIFLTTSTGKFWRRWSLTFAQLSSHRAT